MAIPDKFCLRWTDFENNISGAFQELRHAEDFFDVTLACEDEQIQAHKVILSACSPFFRSILKRNKHQHPLLYLKGVKHTDLVAVLDFMYQGEVNVAQEELNTFLAVAEDLKVKGLTQNDSEKKQNKTVKTAHKINAIEPPKHSNQPLLAPPDVDRPKTVSSVQHSHHLQSPVQVKSEPFPVQIEEPYTSSRHLPGEEGIVADPNMEYGEGYEDYTESYSGQEAFEGVFANPGEETKALEDLVLSSMSSSHCAVRGAMWTCNHCGKEDKDKNNMRRHVESHFNFKHTCNYCGKVFKSRPSMQSRISRKHKDDA